MFLIFLNYIACFFCFQDEDCENFHIKKTPIQTTESSGRTKTNSSIDNFILFLKMILN